MDNLFSFVEQHMALLLLVKEYKVNIIFRTMGRLKRYNFPWYKVIEKTVGVGPWDWMRSPPVYNRDLPLLQEINANAVRLYGWMNDISHQAFLDAAYQKGILVVVAYRWNWSLYGTSLSTKFRKLIFQLKDNSRCEMKSLRWFRTVLHIQQANIQFSTFLTNSVFMWAIGNELNLGRGYQTDVWDFIASLKSKLENRFSPIPKPSFIRRNKVLELGIQ